MGKGRKPGVTNADVAKRRALEARLQLARKIAQVEAIALLDFMMGFHGRALRHLDAIGPHGPAAAERIRSRSANYFDRRPGRTETAAIDHIKGLSEELQEHVLQLAAMIDQLEKTAPAAHRSLVNSLSRRRPQRNLERDKKT